MNKNIRKSEAINEDITGNPVFQALSRKANKAFDTLKNSNNNMIKAVKDSGSEIANRVQLKSKGHGTDNTTYKDRESKLTPESIKDETSGNFYSYVCNTPSGEKQVKKILQNIMTHFKGTGDKQARTAQAMNQLSRLSQEKDPQTNMTYIRQVNSSNVSNTTNTDVLCLMIKEGLITTDVNIAKKFETETDDDNKISDFMNDKIFGYEYKNGELKSLSSDSEALKLFRDNIKTFAKSNKDADIEKVYVEFEKLLVRSFNELQQKTNKKKYDFDTMSEIKDYLLIKSNSTDISNWFMWDSKPPLNITSMQGDEYKAKMDLCIPDSGRSNQNKGITNFVDKLMKVVKFYNDVSETHSEQKFLNNQIPSKVDGEDRQENDVSIRLNLLFWNPTGNESVNADKNKASKEKQLAELNKLDSTKNNDLSQFVYDLFSTTALAIHEPETVRNILMGTDSIYYAKGSSNPFPQNPTDTSGGKKQRIGGVDYTEVSLNNINGDYRCIVSKEDATISIYGPPGSGIVVNNLPGTIVNNVKKIESVFGEGSVEYVEDFDEENKTYQNYTPVAKTFPVTIESKLYENTQFTVITLDLTDLTIFNSLKTQMDGSMLSILKQRSTKLTIVSYTDAIMIKEFPKKGVINTLNAKALAFTERQKHNDMIWKARNEQNGLDAETGFTKELKSGKFN